MYFFHTGLQYTQLITLSDTQRCIFSILVYSTLSSSPFLTHKGVFFPYWSTVHSARHPFWQRCSFSILVYSTLSSSPIPKHKKGVFFIPALNTLRLRIDSIPYSDTHRCFLYTYHIFSSSHPLWHGKDFFHTCSPFSSHCQSWCTKIGKMVGLSGRFCKLHILTHKGVSFIPVFGMLQLPIVTHKVGVVFLQICNPLALDWVTHSDTQSLFVFSFPNLHYP